MYVLGIDPILIHALRKDLTAANFTVDAVEEVIGLCASKALLRNERTPALQIAREKACDLSVLTRLFVLWDDVDPDDVERVLPNFGLDGLQLLGLATVGDGGMVRALVQLQPHEVVMGDNTYNWWIASDLGEGLTGRAPSRDHVLGIGGATRTLLEMTPRDKVGSVLDLGTGCGILAMYATLHADRVVATDLSERAYAFARFNAALNDLDIDLRMGSLYEPVEGEYFDLIVSNPPFVITPDSLREHGLVEYRDGGRRGDDLVKEVVQGAADHLHQGGRAIMLGNWEIEDAAGTADTPANSDAGKTAGEQAAQTAPVAEVHADVPAWAAHPAAWLKGTDLHAWVIQREHLDPAQYVEMWMRDNGSRLALSPQSFEETYSLWLEDFQQRGVEAVGLGAIVLLRPRKSEKPNRVFEEIVTTTTAPGKYVGHTMELIARGFEVTDDSVLVRAQDVREERHYEPGEPDPQVIIATQGDGFAQRIQLNTSMSAVLGACDGELTVGQIISAIHILTDEDRDVISSRVYHQVAHLVRAGMLVPSEISATYLAQTRALM